MAAAMKWLKGKKSYLGTIAAGTLGVLWSCGLVDNQTATIAASIILSLTGVSFRAAIAKGG